MHAKDPTPVDLVRLQKGDEALALGEPETTDEIYQQLDLLRDGIIALQSVEDLASDRANDLAWRNLEALQAKHRRLIEKLGVH